MKEFSCIDLKELSLFAHRSRRGEVENFEASLSKLFQTLMEELNEFVPSQISMIFLDDPVQKRSTDGKQPLYCISAYGKNSQSCISSQSLSNQSIFHEAYHLGQSSIHKASNSLSLQINAQIPDMFQTLLTLPIKIENSIVGILVLANKQDPLGFTLRDLRLSQVFSGYLSTSLQNAIDAKKSLDLAKIDDLTGLANDRFFHKKLEHEIVHAYDKKADLCLMFLDLDHFKSINDQYGHLIGSQTLREVGFLIQDELRDPNFTLARYGGDEYVAILPNVDLSEALQLSESLRKAIHSKFFMIPLDDADGSMVSFKSVISASIGIASLQDHLTQKESLSQTKNEFIKLADAAMYEAKALGKNRVEPAIMSKA